MGERAPFTFIEFIPVEVVARGFAFPYVGYFRLGNWVLRDMFFLGVLVRFGVVVILGVHLEAFGAADCCAIAPCAFSCLQDRGDRVANVTRELGPLVGCGVNRGGLRRR